MHRPVSHRVGYVFLEPYVPRHGGYSHAEAIIRHLRARGLTIDLFAPHYATDAPLPGFLKRLAKQLLCVARFTRNAGKFDVAYVRYHPISVLPAAVAWLLSRPMILEINGPWYDVLFNWKILRPFSGLVRFVTELQMKMADAIVAVTPQLAEMAGQVAGRGRAVHVPNGADLVAFRPGVPRPPIANLPARYVAFCSYLSLWQGTSTLMDAVSRPEWPPDLPLVVAGDGPEVALVSDAARRHPDRIVFLGVVPHTDIAAILANASMAVVAVTNLDGRADTGMAPIKLFEAMASGIPVVATDLPFQSQIVGESRCGLLFQPGSSAELAQRVRDIAENPNNARAMGAAGRAAVETRYSWQRAADATAELIDALVERRARKGEMVSSP
jgi:glycosyltransferase involved in cell wall biosynthesis